MLALVGEHLPLNDAEWAHVARLHASSGQPRGGDAAPRSGNSLKRKFSKLYRGLEGGEDLGAAARAARERMMRREHGDGARADTDGREDAREEEADSAGDPAEQPHVAAERNEQESAAVDKRIRTESARERRRAEASQGKTDRCEVDKLVRVLVAQEAAAAARDERRRDDERARWETWREEQREQWARWRQEERERWTQQRLVWEREREEMSKWRREERQHRDAQQRSLDRFLAALLASTHDARAAAPPDSSD